MRCSGGGGNRRQQDFAWGLHPHPTMDGLIWMISPELRHSFLLSSSTACGRPHKPTSRTMTFTALRTCQHPGDDAQHMCSRSTTAQVAASSAANRQFTNMQRSISLPVSCSQHVRSSMSLCRPYMHEPYQCSCSQSRSHRPAHPAPATCDGWRGWRQLL